MPHAPRHSGGFSSGQSVIGSNTQASLPPSMGFQPSSPTANIGAMNQAAYQSMADQGISSLSGTVTDNQAGQQAAQQQQNQGVQTIQQAAQEANQQAAQEAQKDEGKGLIETLLSNTVVANALKGAQSTDRFFNNLTEKGVDGLTPEDKVILANLIGRGGLDTIDLNKYTTDDVDFEELGKRFTEAASGLENKDYESLVDSYLSNKPTGIDSLTTMGSDLFNLFGDPRLRRDDATLPIAGSGSLTLEGLQDALGKEGIAYLKATNPKLYYSFTDPQTSGGLEELAKFDLSTLGNSPEDRRLSARVMAAREATSGQGGGQTGITSIPSSNFIDTITTPNMDITKPGYTGDPNNPFGLPGDYGTGFMQSEFYKPGQPGLAVMTPVTLPDGTTHMFPDSSSANQFQQYLDHLAMNKMGPSVGPYQAVKTPAGVPAALNYANIAPQFTSAYAQQGIVNPLMMNPAFQQFRQNLGLFPGMA
jgi:hypothetical protein